MLSPRTESDAWATLLSQGLSGHHPLFEPELVRFTMRRADGPPLSPDAAVRLRTLVDAMEASGDTIEQREWVAGSPLEVQETLVRAYFDTLFAYLDMQPILAN